MGKGRGLHIRLNVSNGYERDHHNAQGFELDLHIPAAVEDDAYAACKNLLHTLMRLQHQSRTGDQP